MNEDTLRNNVIQVMTGFMKDRLYEGQDIDPDDLTQTAAIYYDLVMSAREVYVKAEKEAVKASKAASKAGLVDASNATQVDLMGGPRAVDNNTTYKG